MSCTLKMIPNIHHVCQFVQDFVDLLAVREADVRLAHQTPHLLSDVIFIHLKTINPFGWSQKQRCSLVSCETVLLSASACRRSCCAAELREADLRRPPGVCGHALRATSICTETKESSKNLDGFYETVAHFRCVEPFDHLLRPLVHPHALTLQHHSIQVGVLPELHLVPEGGALLTWKPRETKHLWAAASTPPLLQPYQVHTECTPIPTDLKILSKMNRWI